MKVYIGDAVYAEFDGWGITLTTEDGVRVTNRIYLEPRVLAELDRFRENAVEKSFRDDTRTALDLEGKP